MLSYRTQEPDPTNQGPSPADHAGVDNRRSAGVGLLGTIEFEPVASIERHGPRIVGRHP